MRKYKKPEFHFIRNSGGLSDEEIVKLSDDQLTQYLKQDSMLQEKKRYRVKSDFILREIAGEYAIVPIGSDSMFSNAVMAPNDSAVFLWKAFEQPSTIQDTVAKGMLEYEVAEDTIRRSIERFVKEMLEYKILEEVDQDEKDVE